MFRTFTPIETLGFCNGPTKPSFREIDTKHDPQNVFFWERGKTYFQIRAGFNVLDNRADNNLQSVGTKLLKSRKQFLCGLFW